MGCGKPSPDSYLCPTCMDQTRDDWKLTAWLWAQLEITLTRQAKLGKDQVGSRGDYRPLPWVQEASQLMNDLHGIVHSAVASMDKFVDWHRRSDVGPRNPKGPTAGAIEWARSNVDVWKHHPRADEWLDQLHRVNQRGLVVIDYPEDQIFVGKCGLVVKTGKAQSRICTVELFADPAEEIVECWGCHGKHSLEDRRADMMRRARDYVSHSGRLATLITLMGIPMASSTIRRYASQRGLLVISVDSMGRPQYRVRDVLNIRMGVEFWTRLDRSA
jgi:hypothetical protein